jgi:hypothetical protein
VIVVHDYGYGFHVNAVATDEGRWNAEVKIRYRQ